MIDTNSNIVDNSKQ